MADIIRLNSDPHRIAQELFPWYIKGALDLDEVATVEAHLEGCAACRAELETDRALSAMMAAAPSDVEVGWATLRGQIEARPSPGPAGVGRRLDAPRRRRLAAFGRTIAVRSHGWAMVAQAASLMVIAGSAWVWASQPQPQYHVLSASKAPATGNMVVIFNPATSEEAMRRAFRGADARVVDGPTATDAYVLHVAAATRASAIGKLRANGQVVLAEPIDGASPP